MPKVTVTYTVHTKPLEVSIKSGRKIIQKITKCRNGWYCACKVFATVEGALSYWATGRKDMASAIVDTELEIVLVHK
jgi:hypothetical protein